VLGSKVSEDERTCTAHHNGKRGNNDKVSFSQSRGVGDSLVHLRRCHHPGEAGKMDNIPRPRFLRIWMH
jgi:hypothetical protein